MNAPSLESSAPAGTHPIERVASVEAGEVSIAPQAGHGARRPGAGDQPTGPAGAEPSAPALPLNPGDEAAPGTAGTGETFCPVCGGDGKAGGQPCAACGGTGQVTVGIGGA